MTKPQLTPLELAASKAKALLLILSLTEDEDEILAMSIQ